MALPGDLLGLQDGIQQFSYWVRRSVVTQDEVQQQNSNLWVPALCQNAPPPQRAIYHRVWFSKSVVVVAHVHQRVFVAPVRIGESMFRIERVP